MRVLRCVDCGCGFSDHNADLTCTRCGDSDGAA